MSDEKKADDAAGVAEDSAEITAKPAAKSEIDELKDKCAEYLNGWKRAQADYQNLLKETKERQSEFVKYANGSLILEFLPVLDNFKSAYKLIPEAEKNSAWVTGFAHIKKQLEDILKNNGVEAIETDGLEFNPQEHEAVEHRATEGVKANTVVAELQSGYKLNGRVIQAAKVVVAK